MTFCYSRHSTYWLTDSDALSALPARTRCMLTAADYDSVMTRPTNETISCGRNGFAIS
jgi:hypothetical protein